MSIDEGLATLNLDKESSWPHRFEEEVAANSVIFEDPELKTYILPPADTVSVVGVSFFVPIHHSFATTHKYFIKRLLKASGRSAQCYVINPAKLPDGLGIVQDVLLKFAAVDKEHQAVFPESFKSMTNKQRSRQFTHGHHYSVYPTQRMLFTKFCETLAKLKDQLCSYEAAGDAGSSSWPMDPEEAVDKGSKEPSTMSMRVVSEASYAMWENPKSSPNDAHLAYLLMHDIKARDFTFKHLSQQDFTYVRLVYRAIRMYIKSVDQLTCTFANVGGYTDSIRKELENVIPSYLHIPDSDSDEDESEDCEANDAQQPSVPTEEEHVRGTKHVDSLGGC